LIALKRSSYGFFGDCVRQVQKPLEIYYYYRNYANSGDAKGNRKWNVIFYKGFHCKVFFRRENSRQFYGICAKSVVSFYGQVESGNRRRSRDLDYVESNEEISAAEEHPNKSEDITE
jgi:hypothetical protein